MGWFKGHISHLIWSRHIKLQVFLKAFFIIFMDRVIMLSSRSSLMIYRSLDPGENPDWVLSMLTWSAYVCILAR